MNFGFAALSLGVLRVPAAGVKSSEKAHWNPDATWAGEKIDPGFFDDSNYATPEQKPL